MKKTQTIQGQTGIKRFCTELGLTPEGDNSEFGDAMRQHLTQYNVTQAQARSIYLHLQEKFGDRVIRGKRGIHFETDRPLSEENKGTKAMILFQRQEDGQRVFLAHHVLEAQAKAAKLAKLKQESLI